MKITFTFLFCLLALTTRAQAPIVLQNGENVFVHSSLDTIVKHAENGNTIYLPGGNVILKGSLIINKELHIIGAGHYPDSSAATAVTLISGGEIRFGNHADRSSLTGVYLYNTLVIGDLVTDTVSFINVSRCNLATLYLGNSSGIRGSLNSNIRFSENVIRGEIYGADAQYCLFQKNIIDNRVYNFNQNCTFNNNIFTYYSYSYNVFTNCSGLIVNNNIFTRDNDGLGASQLNNNIFAVSYSSIPGGTNLGSGNIGSQANTITFVNFDGVGFNYTSDFHLKEGSPGIGGGTDGKDIGIYGTATPYKPSAVPHNPHISYLKISEEAINGLLPVEIKVSAQEN